MPVRDQQEEQDDTPASVVAEAVSDDPLPERAEPDERAEFDERRAKMQRLRAEGIDPYPPVSLWNTRTRIADVLAAHDPATLEAGEHEELSYQMSGRAISR